MLVVTMDSIDAAMVKWDSIISKIGHRKDVTIEAHKELVELKSEMFLWKLDRIMDSVNMD
jgi:hypothetical protein